MSNVNNAMANALAQAKGDRELAKVASVDAGVSVANLSQSTVSITVAMLEEQYDVSVRKCRDHIEAINAMEALGLRAGEAEWALYIGPELVSLGYWCEADAERARDWIDKHYNPTRRPLTIRATGRTQQASRDINWRKMMFTQELEELSKTRGLIAKIK